MGNFKKARESKGISQKEISIVLGVSQPTVSEWESEKKTPAGKNLKQLTELLSCTSDYLLGITDDPTPPGARKNEDNPIPEDYVVFTVNPKGGPQETRMMPLKDFNEALTYAEFKKALLEQDN